MVLLRRGPAPSWRGAVPALYGILAAIGLIVELIVAEYGLTALEAQPGILLDWAPLLAGAIAFALALRMAGSDREAVLAGAITTLALFWLANPAPAAWMPVAALAAVVLVLGLRLTPSTRVAASVPALLGLLAVLQTVPALSSSVAALATLAVYALALWARLPHTTRFEQAFLPTPWTATAAFEADDDA